MIDFEEELKKYTPSMVVRESEEAIRSRELTDMTDILRLLTAEAAKQNGR
ncbi:MAG: hypothetical protein IIZ61_00175 [Lachnospiraceae bacterium]|nr:hypothetical protein [Lachnospiraceae bacterium]